MHIAPTWRRDIVGTFTGVAVALLLGHAAWGATPTEAPRGPPPMPKACTVTADCANACPPDAKGCDCRQTSHGDLRCTPTCQVDTDCPNGRDGRGTCKSGFCAPPGGGASGHGPRTCKVAADCTGACPPEAKGCTCHATPDGESKCAPTCSVDADCPRPNGEAQTCTQGICRRPRPPAAK
jgi:hypothetical protein